jgi:hypothetical protein
MYCNLPFFQAFCANFLILLFLKRIFH